MYPETNQDIMDLRSALEHAVQCQIFYAGIWGVHSLSVGEFGPISYDTG